MGIIVPLRVYEVKKKISKTAASLLALLCLPTVPPTLGVYYRTAASPLQPGPLHFQPFLRLLLGLLVEEETDESIDGFGVAQDVRDGGVFGDCPSFLFEGDVDASVSDLAQVQQVLEDVANLGLGLHLHDDFLDSGDVGISAAHYHHAYFVHAFKIIS